MVIAKKNLIAIKTDGLSEILMRSLFYFTKYVLLHDFVLIINIVLILISYRTTRNLYDERFEHIVLKPLPLSLLCKVF